MRNKKGNLIQEQPVVFILLGIFLGLFVIFMFKGCTSARVATGCVNNGGQCAEKCDISTQYKLLGDKVTGCDAGESCCVNYEQQKPADKRCIDKPLGTVCDSGQNLYCNAGSQCVTKCEFCRHNFKTTEGRGLCNPDINKIFANASLQQVELRCSCTPQECTGSDKCIKDFCSDSKTVCCMQ